MRLLKDAGRGTLKLVEKHDSDIHDYAILSHTWGEDGDEVTFRDLTEGTGRNKIGYQKIEFCRAQAARDGLQHFWVDTCCIDKSSSAELTEAINSMFRWYKAASKCYVYLSDVSARKRDGNGENQRTWEPAFRLSKWFTRGWTLQELIAPTSVEFFSREGDRLGSKKSLEHEINEVTKIALDALRGTPLTRFKIEERFSWANHRATKRQEDKAYSLLGLFDIYMPLLYGEGEDRAFVRLREEIGKRKGSGADVDKSNHLVAGPSTVLEIAEEAAFDAVGRDHDPLCLPGTRIDLLQDIRSWLNSDSPKHIYWLSGWAGTGKSTIARTIAQEYANSQWQLGSFFFSRGGGDAGHIHKFVGTIAMQLSYCWPAYKSALRKAIAADEGIVLKTQKAQWATLVQKPFSDLLADSSPPRVLLVIDAVDECGTDNDMSYIIQLLLDAGGINQTALRIFVTSRPEVAIRSGFDHDLDQHHLNLILHQISEFTVQNDLFIFLHHHFTKVRQSRRLGADWPGDASIHRLVAMSGNLFIWAATVCRFVSEGGMLVKKRLLSILERSHSDGPETALDQIYLMVLKSAIGSTLSEEEKAEVTHHFQLTLGTIAVLFAPLSVAGLGHLLSLETEEVEQTLADLHSILDVPSDTKRPIRLHHPSFRDFLCDHSRCRNEALCVDRFAMHSMLADRSLNTMSILRRDICDLKSPGTMVEDVGPVIIQQHLSSVLQYSCRYWLDHSEHGRLSLNDDGPVHRFLQEYFPYWLEAMSLVGKIPEAMIMMMNLRSLIDVSRIGCSAGNVLTHEI
jgi:NACHT domain/Heterokaryon incompatibility protein (HET)